MPESIPSPEHELWRPVVGYEGVYSVSSLGRVRRDVGGRGTRSGIVRKPYPNPDTGYLVIVLGWLGVKRTFAVHQLVAEAFIGPCPERMLVHHKDGNRANPELSNIEYVTAAENIWASIRASGGTSPYLGVYLDRRRGRWASRIKINNTTHWLGYFDDEISAARAYDDAVRRHRGVFGRVNFPRDGEAAA
jgi:hypothetical protein